MSFFQIIDPHKAREFIIINERDFLIEEGWMKKIPSKSTFHAV
ncbi:MAG: hypothetical protein ACTSQ6_10645 [Candidatus Heimdallarchaeaceae archaeon]